MTGWLLTLVRAGIVGCGLMAGVFFAFSVAVMPGLRRLAPSDGIAAMQAINRSILNPVFMVVFVGTALVAAALAVSTAWTWDEGDAGLRLAAGLTYLLGGVRPDGCVSRPPQRCPRSTRPGGRGVRRQVAEVPRRVGAVEPCARHRLAGGDDLVDRRGSLVASVWSGTGTTDAATMW